MYAFRDQNGKILALCIHFRVQSGDSGYMARESCRQGPLFASSGPKSRIARRTCQRCPAFPRQRIAVWPNGLCALRHTPGSLAARAPAISPAPAIRVPYRRKRAEPCSQLNAGIKIGSPNGDPIKCSLVLPSACPTPRSSYGERTNLRFPTWKNYTKRTNLRFPTWITAPVRASGATL